MNLEIQEEKMNHIFTKYHIKGLPFDTVIHRFTEKDVNEHIHDHPFGFTTFILKGSYIERVYDKKGNYEDFHRKENTTHKVNCDTIHEILEFPDGECFTIILPGPWEQQPGFWRFENGKSYYRRWDESEFKEI